MMILLLIHIVIALQTQIHTLKNDLSLLEFSQEGIAKMLHELNVNKACGPDSLSSHVLKQLSWHHHWHHYEKLLIWLYTSSMEARERGACSQKR